ncbi:MAG TPA: peptidoglycan editing factor PgeF [Ignavibacteriaceae bacterium]|nr:peptidoglycan editing factor PgeF [Ignavibacteriaceae bacterium]
MFIIKPHIFNNFPQITAAVSTTVGLNRQAPYYFNLSPNVNDDNKKVTENRRAFFNILRFNENEIAYQYQIHSDIVTVTDSAGNCGDSDALITSKKNLLLVLTIADCTPVLIYDIKNQVIAAVHSGWRGAENKILKKTLLRMNELFNTKGEDLMVYLGPSVSQINYEVSEDVSKRFKKKYLQNYNGGLLLDVANANYDMLIDFHVKINNIQKSVLCTYQMKGLLHSYRRDGNKSGRSLAVIGMRN